MSRFLTKQAYTTYINKLDDIDACRWAINDICCNDISSYLGDYLLSFCKCRTIKDCKYFKKGK